MKGKTVLKRKVNPKEDKPAVEEEYTQSKIIKGKTKLGKNQNLRQQQKIIAEKNISENFIEQVILTYFTARWKDKLSLLKNRVSARPNKKAKDVRLLVRVLDRAINYHTYLYLIDLLETMSEMPMPSGVEHDPDYGKIFLVKNSGVQKNRYEIEVKDIVVDDNKNLREKKDIDNKKDKNVKRSEKKYDEFDDELAIYMYRNDGNPIDRLEIEKEINKLIDQNPEKDIDVERILNSKRLQYKLKNPRFSPFTNKDNLDSFTRYLYTYRPNKNKAQNERLIVIKNKTYAYY